MLREEELLTISHLRENARKSLTDISKAVDVPVSTLFDRMKRYEADIIKKHTSLIDFSKLGFNVAVIMVSVVGSHADKLEEYLVRNYHTNSVYRLDKGFRYLIEAVFKDRKQLDDFLFDIRKFPVLEQTEFILMKDLKREGFLSL